MKKINTAIINNSWKNMTGMKREFKTFIMVGDYIVLIPAFSDTIISVNKYTYMQEVINKDFLSESANSAMDIIHNILILLGSQLQLTIIY